MSPIFTAYQDERSNIFFFFPVVPKSIAFNSLKREPTIVTTIEPTDAFKKDLLSIFFILIIDLHTINDFFYRDIYGNE